MLLLCGCAAIEQQRSIELLVSEARRAQAAGDRATWAEALRRAVVQRREYRAEQKLREPLDGELVRFGEDLRRRIAERTPLSAEALRAEHKALVDEVPSLAGAIEKQIAELKRDGCQRVRERSTTPYLPLLASRYCARLGLPFAAPWIEQVP